jgi:protein-disulfide isomerase
MAGTHGESTRWTAGAAGLLLVLALGGCAGDAASVLSGGPEAQGLETGATIDRPGFNPFAERSENDTPAREVIQSPTRAEVMKAGPLPEFALGRADAPVTLVKYMSLTCPYCRRFQAEVFPVLKRDYIDKGHVRLIIREFPIGKASGNATIALRCAPPDRYLALYEKFLAQQSAWVAQEVRTDAIFKVASQVGVTREQFDACLKDQAMIEGLKWVKERGRQLGVIGTPNFFVEERLVKSTVGVKELRTLIDPLVRERLAGQGR